MLKNLEPPSVLEIEHFALAIAKTAPEQDHCAIVYRDSDGELWLMHLAWHHKLCSESFCFLYQWVPTKRPKPILKFLSVLCEKIRTANPTIPYGLDRTGIHIDKLNGGVVTGKPGKGLTCATFILALFDTYKIKLLKEMEWPHDANQSWQQHIFSIMADPRANIPTEHWEALKDDVGGCRRFTPAEVVGASTATHWPVGFKRAGQLAKKIAAEINHYEPKIREYSC